MIYPEVKHMVITPLSRTHPIRAELELREFGRDQFVNNWDSKKNNCISVPLLTFIDGFGLYRNSYRSLMGFYKIPAAFNSCERNRRANVLPLTLGPHGSNFDDVVAALKSLIPLDRGTLLDIKGIPTMMCAFTLCYIGDMPQQQENSGFKTQRATRGCRFCFVKDTARGDLDFNTVEHGRYHYQTINMRKEMESLLTKKQKMSTALDGVLHLTIHLSLRSPLLWTSSFLDLETPPIRNTK